MDLLQEARKIISEVDEQMAKLFQRRMEAAQLVAAYKKEHGMPILDAAREETEKLRKEGFKEIVLTGIEVASYGVDLPGKPGRAEVIEVVAQAAPVIEPADISEATLKGIATPRQKASLDQYHKAKANAEKQREKDAKAAADITRDNDAGMKKTIQRRALNTMLPPCDREPEAPRDPGNYDIRY